MGPAWQEANQQTATGVATIGNVVGEMVKEVPEIDVSVPSETLYLS